MITGQPPESFGELPTMTDDLPPCKAGWRTEEEMHAYARLAREPLEKRIAELKTKIDRYCLQCIEEIEARRQAEDRIAQLEKRIAELGAKLSGAYNSVGTATRMAQALANKLKGEK